MNSSLRKDQKDTSFLAVDEGNVSKNPRIKVEGSFHFRSKATKSIAMFSVPNTSLS